MGASEDFIEIAKDNNIKLDHMDRLVVFPKILMIISIGLMT